MKFFTVFLFTIMGWKLQGQLPANTKKCIVVAAPHTSNFDFIFAMAGFYKMKIPIRYLLKQELFNFFLLKRFFVNSGGMGVDRSKNNTLVETLVELITSSKENIALMIAPEGTRKLTRRWKTGFYYTALNARIPIVLSHLDYSRKLAVVGPSFIPCGCYRRDMQILKNYYKNITPRHPEKFSLDIYETDHEAVCAG